MGKDMYIHTELKKFKCCICGKEFERYESQSVIGYNNYCSLECEYDSNLKNSKSKRYSLELKNSILNYSLEKENVSARNIAKIFGVSKDMVIDLIKKYGNREPKKLIKFNRDYFKSIDTEEKAYWLGFAYTDGCIKFSGSYSFDLTLKYSDINHLEKFKKHLKYEGSIKKRKIKLNDKMFEACRLILSSEDLCKDLINLGCTINKTFTIKFPDEKIVPRELLKHFIRGCFDGDGSVGLYKFKRCKNKKYQIAITGLKSFLYAICKYLKEELKDDFGEIPSLSYKDKKAKSDLITQFNKSGRLAENIIKFLYKDSKIYLDRKYEIIKPLLE